MPRRHDYYVDEPTAVGVLDKSVSVLAAAAQRPCSLAELVAFTGLARPTAHRLAAALVAHRLLRRDAQGRYAIGPRCEEFSRGAGDPLLERAERAVAELRDATGESAQFYRREGPWRRCVRAADRVSGLRDTVAVGALLPMTAGSAAHVLVAFGGEPPPDGAAFSTKTVAAVARRGWAASVAEREQGVASVSAPVLAGDGTLLGALSLSGPVERLGRSPGREYAAAVVAAAARLAEE